MSPTTFNNNNKGIHQKVGNSLRFRAGRLAKECAAFPKLGNTSSPGREVTFYLATAPASKISVKINKETLKETYFLVLCAFQTFMIHPQSIAATNILEKR